MASKTDPIVRLWMEFVHPKIVCGLCGNRGILDTRGHVTTAAGIKCGVRRYCICPNGRELQKQRVNQLKDND